MTLHRRLLEQSDTDPFKRMLLRSAALDGPAPLVRRRTRAAVAAAAAGAAALGAVPAAAGASSLGTATAAAGSTFAFASLVKLVGVGFVVGLGVMGGASLVSGNAPAPRPSHAAATTAVTVRAPSTAVGRAAPPVQSSVVASEPDLPPAQTSTPERAAARARPAGKPQPGARASDARRAQQAEELAAELTALDEARRALAAGNSGEALRRLDHMGERFPEPSLAQETTVVRIEALAKSGDRAAAREQAERFLRAHPSSPYAARVRQLMNAE